MITVLFKDNKQLSVQQKAPIFQGENLADRMRVLIPERYGNALLSDCDIFLKCITSANTVVSIQLFNTNQITKGMMVYEIPVKTEFTKCAGKMNFFLSFSKLDFQMFSEESCINISPKVTKQSLDLICNNNNISNSNDEIIEF